MLSGHGDMNRKVKLRLITRKSLLTILMCSINTYISQLSISQVSLTQKTPRNEQNGEIIIRFAVSLSFLFDISCKYFILCLEIIL